MLQHKTFPCYNFKVVDAEQGIVEAIVSVFNYVDSGNDRVLYGAFNSSLKKRTPKGVRMHDWNSPVAKTLLALELAPNDPRLPQELKQYGGLYIKGQYNLDTQVGRETFSDVKFGTLDEYSIGFGIVREKRNKELGCNDIEEVELYEWSNVLFGMNDQTTTISAKTMDKKFTPLTDFLKTKGQELGTYAEAYASWYGVSALMDMCMYNVVWKAMCGACDKSISKEECMQKIEDGLKEMSDLILKMTGAMMPETTEEMEEMASEVKLLFEPVDEKVFSNRTTVKLLKEIEDTKGIADRLIARIQATAQTKEGRVFSETNWTKLNDNTEKIGDAYDSMRELLDSVKKEEKVTPLSFLKLKAEAA